jgi:hypothetical protein
MIYIIQNIRLENGKILFKTFSDGDCGNRNSLLFSAKL